MTSKTTFSCGESLDITNALSLYARLQKALQRSTTIELKAESVQKADTAGLQLFVSLIQELNTTGGQIIWKKPSPALLSAAEQLGLSTQLKLA